MNFISVYSITVDNVTMEMVLRTYTGKVTMMGQDTRKACEEFVQAIRADPTHFGAYKCQYMYVCVTRLLVKGSCTIKDM